VKTPLDLILAGNQSDDIINIEVLSLEDMTGTVDVHGVTFDKGKYRIKIIWQCCKESGTIIHTETTTYERLYSPVNL
jgi:hypothetical protein